MCLQCMVSRIVLALPPILLGSSPASCTYSNLLQTLTDLEKGQPHYKEQVPCNCSLCSYEDERLLFELPQPTCYCSLSQKGCWISMKGPILWYLSADFYCARIYINEFPSQMHQSKILVKIAIQYEQSLWFHKNSLTRSRHVYLYMSCCLKIILKHPNFWRGKSISP